MRKGFTIIELLMVLLMVGILTTIAYPSYRNYVAKARRTDGQSTLLNLASRLERYYSEHNTYQTATIGTGGADDVLSSNISPEGWYSVSITAATATSYTLQATPLSTQASSDLLCQALTLNNLGQKGIATGPGGSPTSTATLCWQ